MESTNRDYPAIPIAALFDASGTGPNLDSDPRQALAKAKIITVVDVMTRHECAVFGRKLLKKIAAGCKEVPMSQWLRIELDLPTDELEQLCALVEVVKGRHEYQAQAY